MSNQAEWDAVEMIRNFKDEIVEAIMDKGEASDDFNNDYSGGDEYHHQTHVDKEYDPEEAIAILKEYDEYEETDSGLWQGLEGWKAQLCCVAAYTYGNAVYANAVELIKNINGAVDELEYDGELMLTLDDIEEAIKTAAKEKVAASRNEEARAGYDKACEAYAKVAEEMDGDGRPEEPEDIEADDVDDDDINVDDEVKAAKEKALHAMIEVCAKQMKS